MVECKNYRSDIGNPEIDQLEGRLTKRKGMFGILACRTVENKPLLLQRCRDIVHDDKGFILVLDDQDFAELLHFKDVDDEKAIDDFFCLKLDQLIM